MLKILFLIMIGKITRNIKVVQILARMIFTDFLKVKEDKTY